MEAAIVAELADIWKGDIPNGVTWAGQWCGDVNGTSPERTAFLHPHPTTTLRVHDHILYNTSSILEFEDWQKSALMRL